MKLENGHYYECLAPPASNFTKGKDYQVFSDEFGNLVVYPDCSVKTDSPIKASVWIDEKHFSDVTDKYEIGITKFIPVYKIVYIKVKVGQQVGKQDTFRVAATPKEKAVALFEAHKEAGYTYHIQYWES